MCPTIGKYKQPKYSLHVINTYATHAFNDFNVVENWKKVVEIKSFCFYFWFTRPAMTLIRLYQTI